MTMTSILIGGAIGTLYSLLKYKYQQHKTDEQFKRIHYCGDFLIECMSYQEPLLGDYPYMLYQTFSDASEKRFSYEVHYFNKRCMAFEDRQKWVTTFRNDVTYYEITNTLISFLLNNGFENMLSNIKNFKCLEEKNIDLEFLPCYNKLLTKLSMHELTE